MNRLVALLGIAALAGAIALDATVPPSTSEPRGVAPAATGTALTCPFAVEPTARAFVHLANFGDTAARVRVSLVPSRGKAFVNERTLGPGKVRTVRVSGRVSGRAAAVVEARGGEVVASHSMWFPARRRTGILRRLVHPRGAAAAPCIPAGGGDLALPHLTTLNGDSRLALFNPGAADADVSVSLVVGNRTVRPERLERRLIPARRLRVFDLGDFVFGAQEVTAVVRHNAGRVVAESLLVTRAGVALVSGTEPIAAPATVAGSTGLGTSLGIAAIGSDDTGLAATVVGRRDQGRARGIPADLAPMSGVLRRIGALDGGGPAAHHLETTVGGPLASGSRWRIASGGARDIGAAALLQPALRWAAPVGLAVPSGTARAIIVNLGEERASVRVRRLGGEGAEDLAVPAGRLRRVPVARAAPAAAILVESDQPLLVMVEVTANHVSGGLRTAYGFGLEATPLPVPLVTPVAIDARAGVPAPLQRP